MDEMCLQLCLSGHIGTVFCFFQIHSIARRQGERRREGRQMDRHAVSGVRGTGAMEVAASEDTDTGIYLEIL